MKLTIKTLITGMAFLFLMVSTALASGIKPPVWQGTPTAGKKGNTSEKIWKDMGYNGYCTDNTRRIVCGHVWHHKKNGYDYIDKIAKCASYQAFRKRSCRPGDAPKVKDYSKGIQQ